MVSRSFFVNPLTWEQDERRSFLIEELHRLTRATGFYDATAVEVTGGWLLCWWGRVDPDGEFWFQQCQRFPQAGVGTVTLPCCPNQALSKIWAVTFKPWPDYPGCQTLLNVGFFSMEWVSDVEPYGQWVGELRDPDGGRGAVSFRPTGCSQAGQTYEAIFVWEGVEFFRVSWIMACDVGISRGFINQDENGPCPYVFTMFEVDTS